MDENHLLKLIEIYRDKLNWFEITRNPNITWEIIQANPNEDWDWDYVSMNPNITWEIIQANHNEKWNWLSIAQNIFQKHPHLTKKNIKI